jgi:PAS domain-containing protein
MSRLDVQFLDQGLHRVMFDAMPMPVFLVDKNVTILDYNAAAARLLGQKKDSILRKPSGEILHCVHSLESPQGCGHSSVCADCVVRKSVAAAYQGKRVVRQQTTMELFSGGTRRKVDLKVSTNPLQYQEQSFVLLVLEGLNDSVMQAQRPQ